MCMFILLCNQSKNKKKEKSSKVYVNTELKEKKTKASGKEHSTRQQLKKNKTRKETVQKK